MASSPETLSGLEGSSVRATRNETIRIGSVALVLVLTAVALRSRAQPSTASDIVLALAVVLSLTGAVLRRSLPWLSVAGLAGAVAAAPPMLDTRWRADSSTVIFLLAYFGIVLLPRRAALLWLGLPVVMWALLAPRAGIPVGIFGAEVNARWLTLPQLVISGLFLSVVWERELRGAVVRDRVMLERERDRLEALHVQERVRVWRQMLVETHETVLNDIRYVLATDSLDAAALGEQLRVRSQVLTPVAARATVKSIVGSVARAEGIARIHVAGANPEVDRRQSEALTTAVREVVRNAQRHASASAIWVRCDEDDAGITLVVRDGRPEESVAASAGIGRAVVIDGSLAGVGGTATVRPDGIDLWIPHDYANGSTEDSDVSNVGRAVLAAVTTGNVVGGSGFAGALVLGQPGLASVGVLLCSAVGAAIALRAFVRRVLTPRWLVVSALVAVGAPVLARIAVAGCGWAEVSVIIGALSGFALCSSLVWSARRGWWLLGLPWLVAMVVVSTSLPDSCAGTTGASFRAAALPALFFAAITVSLYRSSARLSGELAARRTQIAEMSSASAALEASRHLEGAIAEATSIMESLASGQPLEPSVRNRLRCLDAEIRAAVQVDPSLAGGVAVAAREIVRVCARAGIPVRVLTLRDSGDRTPVPAALRSVVEGLLLASTEGSAQVQLLASETDDTLVVNTTVAAANRAGLSGRVSMQEGRDEISFDEADDPEVAVLFLRRVLGPA